MKQVEMNEINEISWTSWAWRFHSPAVLQGAKSYVILFETLFLTLLITEKNSFNGERIKRLHAENKSKIIN